MGGFNIDLVQYDKNSDSVAPVNSMHVTAWKVSVFGIFLVHIFPHSDWIRRDTQNAVKYWPEKLRIRYFSRNVPLFLSYICARSGITTHTTYTNTISTIKILKEPRNYNGKLLLCSPQKQTKTQLTF